MDTQPAPTRPRSPGFRWPATLAVFGAMVMPIGTLDHTRHLGPVRAWGVHAAGLVLGGLAILGVQAAFDVVSEPSVGAWGARFAYLVEELAGFWQSATGMDWARLVAAGVALEAGVIVSGWLVLPWGAQPEPMGLGVLRTVRRLWLVTPHGATVVVAGSLPAWLAVRAAEAWQQEYGLPTPWHVELLEAIAFGVVLAAALWALRVVLAASSSRRWYGRCRWPAVCEDCGYALLGLTGGQACPECGRPDAAPTPERHRPGLEGLDGGAGWRWPWRCAWWAVARPQGLGRQLRLDWPEHRHRSIVRLASVLTMLVCLTASVVFAMYSLFRGSWFFESAREAALFGLIFGASTGVQMIYFLVFITLFWSAVIGGIASLLARVPLLTAAIQGACCLSVYVVAAGVVNLLVFTLIVPNAHWVAGTAVGVIVATVTVLAYPALLWRIVWAARFANE